MKKPVLIYVTIAVTAFLGQVCTRTEPGTVTGETPAGAATLQPIAQYYIGTNVPEPSGITYLMRNNSFLIVSDSRPEVYEIDPQGRLLRTIPTNGSDLEGIALSNSGDTLYVVEEKNRRVVSYSLAGTPISSFRADVATLANNALEGITVGKNGVLHVLNEKSPGMIIRYRPDSTEIGRTTLTLASDYSDIFYDAGRDCFWIVSDESKKVLKTTTSGSLIAQWPLPFTKGEGICIVRDTMYIVNDADGTLYVFQTPN